MYPRRGNGAFDGATSHTYGLLRRHPAGTGTADRAQGQGEGEGKERNGAAAALSLSLSYPIPSPVSVLQGSSRDFRRLITSWPPSPAAPRAFYPCPYLYSLNRTEPYLHPPLCVLWHRAENQPWSESDIYTSAGFRSPGAQVSLTCSDDGVA